MNFVPTCSIDELEFIKDFHSFCRKLRLKIHFANSSNISDKSKIMALPEKLRTTSTFDPQEQSKMLDAFQESVTQEVHKKWNKYEKYSKITPNITRKDKEAIKALSEDDTLITKKADKGGAIVIMDNTLYLNEVGLQLSDITVYKKLPSDPTVEY